MPEGAQPYSPSDEFRALMERVRTGCPGAAEAMCRLYGGHIRRIVRRRLHHRLRPQYDSLDFMQDVWASFFAAPRGKDAFDDPQSLIGYLSNIAYNKVADVFRRRFRTQKDDVRREEALAEPPRGRREGLEPPGRAPTPSQVAIANEHWTRLLDGQPHRSRLVLEMLRLGYSHAEIGERVGLHPRTIKRLVRKMAQRRDLQ